MRSACLSVAIAVAMATFGFASAAAAEGDGAYGRLEGDVLLTAGAGVALAQGGPALAARGSVLYLGTAGAFVQYADALGSHEPTVARSFACGLSVKPLFLARYASNLENGPPRLDLLIDSL